MYGIRRFSRELQKVALEASPKPNQKNDFN
jgi:hypothetical protein